MNISVLEYFDNVYVSNGVKIALSTHSNFVNLKMLTILTKRLTLDAWLGPGRASAN